MWVFLSDAFLSVVADRNNADRLLVRARLPGDIGRAFMAAGLPVPEVKVTPDADYRYRCFAAREVVVALMSASVRSIDYPNFKGSVGNTDRHDTYMDVWCVMHQAQSRARRPDALAPPVDDNLPLF